MGRKAGLSRMSRSLTAYQEYAEQRNDLVGFPGVISEGALDFFDCLVQNCDTEGRHSVSASRQDSLDRDAGCGRLVSAETQAASDIW